MVRRREGGPGRGRAVAAVAAAAVLSLAAAACSSSKATPKGPTPADTLQSALTATLAGGTVTEAVVAVTPTASASSTSKGTGRYSFSASQGTFSVDTGAILGTLDVLVDQSTLYIHLPASVAATVAKGKAWATVSLDNPPAVPGVGNLPALAGGADPSRLLEMLQDGVSSVTLVGTEPIDGQPTTHLRAQVDLDSAARRAPAARQPLARSEAILLGGTTVTADVWIGADGRLRRVVDHLALPGGSSGSLATTANSSGAGGSGSSGSASGGAAPGTPTETVTVDLTAYGTPVAVTLPPPDQVVDAAKLLGQ